ncbi:NAD(P)-binding protein [Aureobasidium pullulans]|uniref:NAD(P)-binding protein n=1 Tax=Aureobasidium pullulans TaxID=5580 RepID=A0A4S9PIU6_AURPU|nr:NAD(P)-binding protein [Aureobasidium pullulans]THZ36327.1 NAD(P)-binding protein [Aureobasidium pullulans]THZ54778.1 NAD(P)-binding protein [Aureobasidium pullulans]
MATYLITGASRGIGLELTKQLLDLPASQVSKIFAVARNTDTGLLQELVQKHHDRVVPISASVQDNASVQKAVEAVKANLQGKGLDVLVNNAGVMDHSPGKIGSMETDQLTWTLDINVVGVQRVTAAFLPLLEQGTQKKIVNISSGFGSFAYVAYTAAIPADAYNISKAALNMLTVRYAHQYADAGFTVVALSPGWIKTDMGSQDADLSVEVGVAEVKRVILESGKEQNGKFLNINVPKTDEMKWSYDGQDIPW